jgi:transcriptional regulator with XRE-family HTH domain
MLLCLYKQLLPCNNVFMAIVDQYLSSADWEQRVGEQLRRIRLEAGLDQEQLSARADVSIGALRNLERGNGSTMKTLVRVARALGREDWLGGIAPAVSVSPIDVFKKGRQPRSRVYRPRGPAVRDVANGTDT